MTRPACAALLAVLAAAPAARAETFDYASLPSAAIGLAPKRAGRPEAIAPGARVAGFIVGTPPPSWAMADGLAQLYLFSSDKQREDTFGVGLISAVRAKLAPDEPRGCFLTSENYGSDDAVPWPLRFMRMATVQGTRRGTKAAQTYGDYYVGTTAVRYETVEPSGDGAVLAAVEAWADPVSGGLRAIRSERATFKLVAEGPGGVKVFAARDAGAVHFLLQRPLEPAPRLSGGWTLRAGSDAGHSDCGHAHLTLRATPGAGQTGSVRLEVPLGLEDAHDGQAPQVVELRFRTLEVDLSLSRAAGDAAPLPSVSFGWASDEQRTQTFK